jgi:hypothetical protein
MAPAGLGVENALARFIVVVAAAARTFRIVGIKSEEVAMPCGLWTGRCYTNQARGY